MKFKKLLFSGLFLSSIFISETYSSLWKTPLDIVSIVPMQLDSSILKNGMQQMELYLTTGNDATFARQYTLAGKGKNSIVNPNLASFITNAKDSGLSSEQWARGLYFSIVFVSTNGDEIDASGLNVSSNLPASVHIRINDVDGNQLAFEKISNNFTSKGYMGSANSSSNPFIDSININRIFFKPDMTGWKNNSNYNSRTWSQDVDYNVIFAFSTTDQGMADLKANFIKFKLLNSYKLTAKEQVESAGFYFDLSSGSTKGSTTFPVSLSPDQITFIKNSKNVIEISYQLKSGNKLAISVLDKSSVIVQGKNPLIYTTNDALDMTDANFKNLNTPAIGSEVSKAYFIYRTSDMINAKSVECGEKFSFMKSAKDIPVALKAKYPSQSVAAAKVPSCQLAPEVPGKNKGDDPIVAAETIESVGMEFTYSDGTGDSFFIALTDSLKKLIDNGKGFAIGLYPSATYGRWNVVANEKIVKTINVAAGATTHIVYKTSNMLHPKSVEIANLIFAFVYEANFVYGQKDFPATSIGSHSYKLIPGKSVTDKDGKSVTVGAEKITHFGVSFKLRDASGEKLTNPIPLSVNQVDLLNAANETLYVSTSTQKSLGITTGNISITNKDGDKVSVSKSLLLAGGSGSNDLSKPGTDNANGVFLPGGIVVIQTTNTMEAKTYPFDNTFSLEKVSTDDVQLVSNSEHFPTIIVGGQLQGYEIAGVKDSYGKITEKIDEFGVIFGSKNGSSYEISYPVRFGRDAINEINDLISGTPGQNAYVSVSVKNGLATLYISPNAGGKDSYRSASMKIYKSVKNLVKKPEGNVSPDYEPAGCACIFKTTNMTYPKTSPFPINGSFEFSYGKFDVLFKGNPDFRPTFNSLSETDAENIITSVKYQGASGVSEALKSAGYTGRDWTVILQALQQVYGASLPQKFISDIKYKLGVNENSYSVSESGASQIISKSDNYNNYKGIAQDLYDAGFTEQDWDDYVVPALKSSLYSSKTAIKDIHDLFSDDTDKGGSGHRDNRTNNDPGRGSYNTDAASELAKLIQDEDKDISKIESAIIESINDGGSYTPTQIKNALVKAGFINSADGIVKKIKSKTSI